MQQNLHSDQEGVDSEFSVVSDDDVDVDDERNRIGHTTLRPFLLVVECMLT